MGMRIENYYEYVNEQSIEKHLICNICQRPFIQPVITPCENTFCRQCMEQSLDDHELGCFLCIEPHSKKDLIPVSDPSVLAVLDQIQVRCKLCDQTNIERASFQSHIYQICPKSVVTCPAVKNNCPWIGLREQVQTHLNICTFELLTSNTSEKNLGEFLPFTKINLQQHHFQNQDIPIAVKALLINKRCTCLDLFNKGISSEGASMIASVLHNDTLLETLGLRNNLICDSGVQFLAHSLATNSCLTRLDLNNNSITDTGVLLLANMLKTNQTLTKLTLSFNRISNEGMDILIDVLINYNLTLQWLSLTGNPAINDSSTHSIINLIRHNQSLRTFNLEDCNLSWWNRTKISFYRTIYLKSNLDLLL